MDVQLVRRALDWDFEPADVLRMLRVDEHPVALLGAWAGGSDIIASAPTQVRSSPLPLEGLGGGESLPGVIGPDSPLGFGGGWIGYLGFGLSQEMLAAPPAPGEPRRLPQWWSGYYDHVLRRDRSTGAWVFEALWTSRRAAALDGRFDELRGRAHSAQHTPQPYSCSEFRLNPGAEDHRTAVARTVDHIRRGDIFQANICLRLEAEFDGDPLDAFCRATTSLQPPYAAFLRVPGGAIASLSPELFLRRIGTTVTTKPIKGTRHRADDPLTAARERELLLHSDKDRAENVMIVDLMRNDLSRVCEAGSVRVPRLLEAQAHPGIWHLVSDVQGTLRAGVGDGELIAASFPPGSVTGAPKVRAVEIIHEMETTPREVYTGAIGYRSPVAGLELNVAIRTFEFSAGRVWLGSGGGITISSDPEQEYRECLLKADPLIAALGAKIELAQADPTGDAGVVTEPMRPRPAAGVFTSLLISGGQAKNLAEHLARLDASTWRLYRKHLPPSLAAAIELALGNPAGAHDQRLRITARPLGGPLQIHTEMTPVHPRPTTVDLVPVAIAGGLGAHKWQDARMRTALTAELVTGEQSLLHDLDGTVLETDRANIFAVIGGVLRTPPADGRILPGTTRAAVLRAARSAEIPLIETSFTLQQLRGASEVFVTNAIYGITSVRSITGRPQRWPAGAVAPRLAQLCAVRQQDRPSIVAAQQIRIRTVLPAGTELSGRLTTRHQRPVVVLVDNYDSFTYNLAHLLLQNHCQVEVVRNDEVSAAEIAAFAPDGIVISPGPCTPADAGISIGVIRACGPTTPLLGVCLGHQAIAVAYGGRVIAAAQPVHGRASSISHDGRGVLTGVPERLLVARYHSLLIDEAALPTDLYITARTDTGEPMGVRHARHPVEGVQFHPESILTEHGAAIIANFTRAVQGWSSQLVSAASS